MVFSVNWYGRFMFGDWHFRMFGNRVPHMLDEDYTPYSAVDIFVKDLVRCNVFSGLVL